MSSGLPTPPGRSTVPVYRAHAEIDQITDPEWKSAGDYASSGNYGSGGGTDEPIDRTASLFDDKPYVRPFGQTLNSAQRQRGRQWMRKIMQDHFGREI
jgi:hypothetical protein